MLTVSSDELKDEVLHTVDVWNNAGQVSQWDSDELLRRLYKNSFHINFIIDSHRELVGYALAYKLGEANIYVRQIPGSPHPVRSLVHGVTLYSEYAQLLEPSVSRWLWNKIKMEWATSREGRELESFIEQTFE